MRSVFFLFSLASPLFVFVFVRLIHLYPLFDSFLFCLFFHRAMLGGWLLATSPFPFLFPRSAFSVLIGVLLSIVCSSFPHSPEEQMEGCRFCTLIYIYIYIYAHVLRNFPKVAITHYHKIFACSCICCVYEAYFHPYLKGKWLDCRPVLALASMTCPFSSSFDRLMTEWKHADKSSYKF